jgi:hypothetical protein
MGPRARRKLLSGLAPSAQAQDANRAPHWRVGPNVQRERLACGHHTTPRDPHSRTVATVQWGRSVHRTSVDRFHAPPPDPPSSPSHSPSPSLPPVASQSPPHVQIRDGNGQGPTLNPRLRLRCIPWRPCSDSSGQPPPVVRRRPGGA